MLLNSIYDIMNQQLAQPKASTAGKGTAPSASVEKEKTFQKMADTVKIPASEATFEAAAKAEGMKKIELEIAAAAGLLRPISPEPPEDFNQNAQSFDDLLRTINELEDPPKSHDLDLFE
jgi:hypothetical protein